MTLVTIIIPVYNAEPFIQASLKSVLNQTHQNFELLIVDNGSSDKSIDHCLKLNDYRIRYVRQQNRGLAGARNSGIRQATGEHIAFLAPRDLWRQDKLEKHLEHLARSPKVGLSFSQSECIDGHGHSLGIHPINKFQNLAGADFLNQNPIGNGSSLMIRQEVFEDIRFFGNYDGMREVWYFDENLSQFDEVDCWLRIVNQTPWEIEGIDEPLTQYRVHPSQASATLRQQFKSWQKMLEKNKMAKLKHLSSSNSLTLRSNPTT